MADDILTYTIASTLIVFLIIYVGKTAVSLYRWAKPKTTKNLFEEWQGNIDLLVGVHRIVRRDYTITHIDNGKKEKFTIDVKRFEIKEENNE